VSTASWNLKEAEGNAGQAVRQARSYIEQGRRRVADSELERRSQPHESGLSGKVL